MIATLVALALAVQPQCRTVHGRLFAANGNPALRIWVIGSRRVLGVDVDQDLSLAQLPANVRRLWLPAGDLFGTSVYGDFQVCSREPQRPGKMQKVRVAHARNLVLRPDH